MIDKGITYDQLLSDINALPSTPSADQLATYDLTGDGVLDAGDARYHIASQPLKQLSPLPPPQEGAQASSGLTPDQRLRAIMDQSGTGLSGGSLEDIMNRPRPELGDGMYTTMAMGEEDGGNPFLPAPPPVGVSPPIDIKPPVPIPRPDNPFLNPGPPVGIDPPPPVGGTAPFNPFPQLPTGGAEGRTYGNYQDQFPAEMLAQTSTAKGPFS